MTQNKLWDMTEELENGIAWMVQADENGDYVAIRVYFPDFCTTYASQRGMDTWRGHEDINAMTLINMNYVIDKCLQEIQKKDEDELETDHSLQIPEAQEEPQDEGFGDVIYSYTRNQAIEDGVLIDVTTISNQAGFKFPVALTVGAWVECVKVPENSHGQDEQGRLWDILTVLNYRIKASLMNREGSQDRVDFKVKVWNGKNSCNQELYAVVGPGDQGEPVITVMLIGED